jgi:carboxyl-terminal processing protease
MFSQKKSTLIATGVVLSIAFFIFGTYVGYNNRPAIDKIVGIEHKETPSEIRADFEPFWKAWSILDEKFRDSKKVNAEDRVWGAIAGLTHSFGDPYTDFFNPKETTDFTETISGSFTGVGLEVDIKDKVLTVVAPIKDSPAYKAGLKTGDIILKIDDANTGELSLFQRN